MVGPYSPSGGARVGNHFPQLRETGQSQFSSDKSEEIAEWVDRVLGERTDWPWDWTKRGESPAWEDDYHWTD